VDCILLFMARAGATPLQEISRAAREAPRPDAQRLRRSTVEIRVREKANPKQPNTPDHNGMPCRQGFSTRVLMHPVFVSEEFIEL